MAAGAHRPGAGVDQPADDVDQGGLAGPVGTQEGEDLAGADLEIDALERLEARGVGLGQASDLDDRRHDAGQAWAMRASSIWTARTAAGRALIRRQ